MYRCCCSRRCRIGGEPGGASVFPLVVGELLYMGAVGIHHKDFSVRLGVAGQRCFVFKAHAAAGEEDAAAVGRPSKMSVVAAGVRDLLQAGAVGLDGKDVEVASHAADESDGVALRRPDWKVVVTVSEAGDVGAIRVHDPQAFTVGA